MIRPIMSYACVSWAGGLNKKYLVKKLTKVQRLACLMISSVFPGTPNGAKEITVSGHMPCQPRCYLLKTKS